MEETAVKVCHRLSDSIFHQPVLPWRKDFEGEGQHESLRQKDQAESREEILCKDQNL